MSPMITGPLVDVTLMRDAADVARYHTKRTIRQQTIGQHSFNMLTLLLKVLPGARRELLLSCVFHDLPELITGDVPAPVKRAHPDLKDMLDRAEWGIGAPLYRDFLLTEEEIDLLKWADRMELVLWCLEEVRYGNTFAVDTVRRGMGWILMAGVPRCACELTDDVCSDMRHLGITPATGEELEATR